MIVGCSDPTLPSGRVDDDQDRHSLTRGGRGIQSPLDRLCDTVRPRPAGATGPL
jgi:hypothetical protein